MPRTSFGGAFPESMRFCGVRACSKDAGVLLARRTFLRVSRKKSIAYVIHIHTCAMTHSCRSIWMSGFANNPPISPPGPGVDRDAHPAGIEFWGVLRPIHLKKKSAE